MFFVHVQEWVMYYWKLKFPLEEHKKLRKSSYEEANTFYS